MHSYTVKCAHGAFRHPPTMKRLFYFDSSSSAWQVIESSKRWWKCRNRFNQIGFVPFNILEPVAHVDSPVTNKPPNVRHKHTRTHGHTGIALTCAYLSEFHCYILSTFLQVSAPPPPAMTSSPVPPSPPTLPQAATHSPQRPRSLPPYSQHIPGAEDTDKGRKLHGLCVGVPHTCWDKRVETEGPVSYLTVPVYVGLKGRAAAPPHQKEPAEVAQESLLDASWTPPWWGVLGVPHWEEEPGHAGTTMSFSWPGNTSGSSWKSWRWCLGIAA